MEMGCDNVVPKTLSQRTSINPKIIINYRYTNNILHVLIHRICVIIHVCVHSQVKYNP